jgi:putative ABC transport system substrate-binding protein
MKPGVDHMKRREFMSLLGGAAATWPIVARAQQRERIRRLGILSGSAERDPNNRTWFSAFEANFRSLGWNEGQNIDIERRYAPGDINRMQTFAKQLVELQPDLILVTNTPST